MISIEVVRHKYEIVVSLVIVGLVVVLYKMSSIPTSERSWTPESALVRSPVPALQDDGTVETLQQAIGQSLTYLNQLEPGSLLTFGPDTVSARELSTSLQDFSQKLAQFGLSTDLWRYLTANYTFYRSAAEPVLYTGYFEAELKGALKKSEKYPYPLYRTPEDLLTVELSKFAVLSALKDLPDATRARLTADKRIVPYYTRAEIDHEQVLAGKGLELAWVSDPVDAFFLHIQGSGVVQFEDGNNLRLGYADSNGQPYRAIGKYLIDASKLQRDQVSMQTIKLYMREHPDEQRTIMDANPSYVFFREITSDPVGSIGVTLTPGRSIATDRKIFPKGALAFISFERTLPNGKHEQVVRFVLNQDSGGAIRGAGRVDYFAGRGPAAEELAGNLRQNGELFFLRRRTDAPLNGVTP